MTTGGPDTRGNGPRGRWVDVTVWVLVIASLIGLAGAIAWYLSNASFELREITFEDDSVDVEMLIPVAPAPESSPTDRPPAAAPVPTGGPDTDGVARPAWVRPPAPFYPALAQSRGIEQGVVQLRCEALASGALGACEILRENPSGAGFAEAALASTRQARVRPYSIDGFETDSTIAFTVRFRVAPEP